jgi:lipopolysaccharide/colanic/teichoic acid biosynthesis glycosyltransferase
MNRLLASTIPYVNETRPTPFRAPAIVRTMEKSGPLRRMPTVKIYMDYTLALVLFTAAIPVIFLCILAIRLTSAGPAIYRQTRVGFGGRVFTIYKLRTMRRDAEHSTGPQWAKPNDVRITPVGRVLRALHFDELPQLWNVLKGEMSLVGPRPERPEIVSTLRKVIPGYDLRHAVKPGLTGYAQIHLPPDSSIESVRQKLVFDRVYLQRYRLGLDVVILFCTVLKVLGLSRFYKKSPIPHSAEC